MPACNKEMPSSHFVITLAAHGCLTIRTTLVQRLVFAGGHSTSPMYLSCTFKLRFSVIAHPICMKYCKHYYIYRPSATTVP